MRDNSYSAKAAWVAIVLLLGGARLLAQQSSTYRLAVSTERKPAHIRQNAVATPVDPTQTVITEEEINDYFAAGGVSLPQGVRAISFQGDSGVVTAVATVDFDQIRGGQRSSNPLLSIFSGTHNVRVEADAAGAGGRGKVHVRTASIDGVQVPQLALEYFLSKYVTPKYPNVGIDSSFDLPDRIDTAAVGWHKLKMTQK